MEKLSSYERTSRKILDLKKEPTKPWVFFDGRKVRVGTQSKHKTMTGRMYRQFWRLKYVRRPLGL